MTPFGRALASQGFGSRRECRDLIEAARVEVNGVLMTDADQEIELDEATTVFKVDGVAWPYRQQMYVMLNKPEDIECSHQATHHKSVFTLLPPHLVRRSVQSAGRLDVDTSGLLLLSDDGQFIHELSSPKYHVPKTYEVHTAQDVTDLQISALENGVALLHDPQPARGTVVRGANPRIIELTIDEGRYHQVKRMLAAAGNHVEKLHRLRVGALELPGDLKPGEWRELTAVERSGLLRGADALPTD